MKRSWRSFVGVVTDSWRNRTGPLRCAKQKGPLPPVNWQAETLCGVAIILSLEGCKRTTQRASGRGGGWGSHSGLGLPCWAPLLGPFFGLFFFRLSFFIRVSIFNLIALLMI